MYMIVMRGDDLVAVVVLPVNTLRGDAFTAWCKKNNINPLEVTSFNLDSDSPMAQIITNVAKICAEVYSGGITAHIRELDRKAEQLLVNERLKEHGVKVVYSEGNVAVEITG